MLDLAFYKNKKILITGHTGFKGSWMCKVLDMAGACVLGYSLLPPTEPSLFNILGFDKTIIDSINEIDSDKVGLQTVIGDICDLDRLKNVFTVFQPEIVIHMAAQPLVRESYKNPVGTYASNVMGTVNILECVRANDSVVSFINVTTDKVYLNREREEGYKEDEELNGYDPYSNSKSCSELVTSSYKNSFFGGDEHVRNNGKRIAITTMRAGNVIGGGDFASDRIIPDCIRAVINGEPIGIRNPYSTRPYQHVLEPVIAYLMVAAKQYDDVSVASSYNVGPDDEGCFTTGNLVNLFCTKWNQSTGAREASWINASENNAPHEANFLKLNCDKLKETLGWKPMWKLDEAMEKIVEWTGVYLDNPGSCEKIHGCMEKQINSCFNK